MDKERIFGKIFFPAATEEFEAWLTVGETEIIIEAAIQSHSTEQWPLMLGRFNGLDQVTFVNCRSAGGVDVGAGGRYRRILVSYFIKGIHISDSDKLCFNRVTLLSPILSEWITESNLIEELTDNKLYRVQDPKEIADVTIGDVQLKISSCHSIRYSHRLLEVKKACTISLQSVGIMHVNDFANVWKDLKKLILFITNKNPEFDKIYLYQGGEECELVNVKDDIRDDRFTQAITILYREIKEVFSTLISNWLNGKDLKGIIDLVLEKSINIDMSSQGFFLNVCVAMETFSDNFLNAEDQGIAERKRKRDLIADSICDDDLKKWFREQSAYWKNPTLKGRLDGYKLLIGAIMGNTFSGIHEPESFIKKIVLTRNDIAHKGKYLNEFTYNELFLAGKVIEYTIRLEVLKHLGVKIEDSILVERARRNVEILAYLNNYNQRHAS